MVLRVKLLHPGTHHHPFTFSDGSPRSRDLLADVFDDEAVLWCFAPKTDERYMSALRMKGYFEGQQCSSSAIVRCPRWANSRKQWIEREGARRRSPIPVTAIAPGFTADISKVWNLATLDELVTAEMMQLRVTFERTLVAVEGDFSRYLVILFPGKVQINVTASRLLSVLSGEVMWDFDYWHNANFQSGDFPFLSNNAVMLRICGHLATLFRSLLEGGGAIVFGEEVSQVGRGEGSQWLADDIVDYGPVGVCLPGGCSPIQLRDWILMNEFLKTPIVKSQPSVGGAGDVSLLLSLFEQMGAEFLHVVESLTRLIVETPST